MVGAAALWGLSGAIIARLDSAALAVASVIGLVSGTTLLGLGRLGGEPLTAALRSLGWWLPLLAALEAANSWLYYTGLRLAPIGIVISLHLCSPVLLLVAQLVRRRRRLGVREITSLSSMAAALAMVGFANPSSAARPQPLLGAMLSLASAAILAVFIVLVNRAARSGSRMSSAGAQQLCSGLLLAPALCVVGPRASELPVLVLIGALVFAPAVALYWLAAGRIRPVIAATIQLLEPASGTAAGLVLFGIVTTPLQLLAAGLTVGAAWVESARDNTSW